MLFLPVLNLILFGKEKIKNTLAVKYSLFAFTIIFLSSFHASKHPFFVSVIDISHKPKENSLQISIKLFTNDFEDALKRSTKKNVDILHPKNKSEMDSMIMNYISKRFNLTINLKKQMFQFIGYEKEEEAIWTYLEIKNIPVPKKINIETKLLYDYLPQQINIVHTEINGVKKSSKVTNPEYKVEFLF